MTADPIEVVLLMIYNIPGHPDHAKVATKLDAMEDKGIGVDFETSLLG